MRSAGRIPMQRGSQQKSGVWVYVLLSKGRMYVRRPLVHGLRAPSCRCAASGELHVALSRATNLRRRYVGGCAHAVRLRSRPDVPHNISERNAATSWHVSPGPHIPRTSATCQGTPSLSRPDAGCESLKSADLQRLAAVLRLLRRLRSVHSSSGQPHCTPVAVDVQKQCGKVDCMLVRP